MTHNFLVEDVFKHVDYTVRRLFDHRPFTDAEIKNLILTFEEKNSCEKQTELFKNCSERLCDINNNLFPKLDFVSCDDYKTMINRIKNIDKSMNDILKIEADKTTERKEKVDLFVRKENEKLLKYMQNMEKRMDIIDKEYDKKREQIEKEYSLKKLI